MWVSQRERGEREREREIKSRSITAQVIVQVEHSVKVFLSRRRSQSLLWKFCSWHRSKKANQNILNLLKSYLKRSLSSGFKHECFFCSGDKMISRPGTDIGKFADTSWYRYIGSVNPFAWNDLWWLIDGCSNNLEYFVHSGPTQLVVPRPPTQLYSWTT